MLERKFGPISRHPSYLTIQSSLLIIGIVVASDEMLRQTVTLMQGLELELIRFRHGASLRLWGLWSFRGHKINERSDVRCCYFYPLLTQHVSDSTSNVHHLWMGKN